MLEAIRVKDGWELWRLMKDGRRVTVIDHETPVPIVISKREMHMANYEGKDALANRLTRVLMGE